MSKERTTKKDDTLEFILNILGKVLRYLLFALLGVGICAVVLVLSFIPKINEKIAYPLVITLKDTIM